MTNNIDLDKPLVGHEYKLKVEPKETGADRNVRLFKDLALFLAALSFVAIIIYMCVVTLISSTSTQDEKKWAMSIVTGATGALIGYLIKK